MHSLIVPLAEMIPGSLTKARARTTVELPEADDAMRLLDDEALTREARAAADAAVVSLCREDDIVTRVDFRRVRALVEREVQVSRGGPVHLTPLYLYLTSFCSDDAAAHVVCSVQVALTRLGLMVATPAAARASEQRRRPKTAVKTRPVKKPAVGTRAGWLAWA